MSACRSWPCQFMIREISACVATNGVYSMADECTDSANKEQFDVCFRWVDKDLNDHEDIIGLYNVDKTDSDTLTKTLRDVSLRMSLSIAQCRGQCYDGASNMIGSRNGVATQLAKDEPRALLTHCTESGRRRRNEAVESVP